MSKHVEDYGWHAVPRSLDTLVANRPTKRPSKPVVVENVPLPESPLAKQVTAYAKEHLPHKTFNHSMRVFYYGTGSVPWIWRRCVG